MKILDDLNRTESQTLDYFALEESDLSKTYGEGKWPARFILHHIADAETVLYDRIRRAISNPNQVVWGFDQDAWAAELDYANKPLSLARDIYTSCRAGTVYLAKRYYESRGANQVVHSGTGLRTLKELFDKVVWHNQRHLDQIEKALSL